MNYKIENTKFKHQNSIVNLLLISAVIITIIGFLVDFRNTITYPGTDLRNRVVGARLMLEGIDPYFFKWQPGLSERFYDPLDIPTELLSKLSVPPTVLVLHSLFAGLSYLQQKIIWLFVQWAALIGTILIFVKTSNSRPKVNLTLITGFMFVSSLFWRFHVNSGQIYIVYVFLLSIAWLFLNRKSNLDILLSGLFIGITISLRPSFILFLIPVIIGKKYLLLVGSFLGTIASVSLSWLVAGTFIWKQYIITMLGMTGFIDLNTYVSPKETIISNTNIIYPQIIEGFDSMVRNPLERYLDNTSLYDVLNALDVPNKRQLLVIGFIATMICLSLLYSWKSSSNNKNNRLVFLWGILTCLIGEFFIPVGRYSYYDIQMILPLLIIINQTNIKDLIYQKSIIILLLGLLLSIVGFTVVPRALFFSAFLIALYIVLICFMLLTKNSTSINQAHC